MTRAPRCQGRAKSGQPCGQRAWSGNCGRHDTATIAPAAQETVLRPVPDPMAADPAPHLVLQQRIAAMGGTVHVDPLDEHTGILLERGRAFDGHDVEFVDGLPSQCHYNAARLHQNHGLRVVTGYAQSEGGGWVCHSWGLTAGGTVVETTVARVRYFGVELDPDEAADFCFWNA